MLTEYAKHHHADLVITLMDVWVLRPEPLSAGWSVPESMLVSRPVCYGEL